jgi:hypothetical protein
LQPAREFLDYDRAMTKVGIAVVAALVLASGCKKITIDAKPMNEGEMVFETSDMVSSLSVTANGKTFGPSSRVHVASLELPLGDSSLEADVKGKRIPFTLHRTAIAPKITLGPPKAEQSDRDAPYATDFCKSSDCKIGAKGTSVVFVVQGPPGETVEIAGQSIKTAGINVDGLRADDPVVTIDLRARVPDLPAANVTGVDLPLKIVADSKYEGVLTIRPDAMKNVMWRVAEEIDKGPMTFGADDVAKGAPRSIFVVGDELIGAQVKFREVDLIAVPLREERDAGRSCGGYGSGGTVSAPLVYVDRNVKVYDRRSGKVVKEKKFTAPIDCPKMVTAVESKLAGATITKGTRAEAMAPFPDVRAWLKTLVR